MLKNKSIDYIFGMITGIAIMITFWACTQNPLNASGDSSSSTTGKYQFQYIEDENYIFGMNTENGQMYFSRSPSECFFLVRHKTQHNCLGPRNVFSRS